VTFYFPPQVRELSAVSTAMLISRVSNFEVPVSPSTSMALSKLVSILVGISPVRSARSGDCIGDDLATAAERAQLVFEGPEFPVPAAKRGVAVEQDRPRGIVTVRYVADARSPSRTVDMYTSPISPNCSARPPTPGPLLAGRCSGSCVPLCGLARARRCAVS